MDTPLLQLEDISFGYDEQPAALRDIHISIFPGERIAIIGNNGAGKSTFFLCCNGVLPPHKGSIRLHGAVIQLTKKKDLNRLRQHVGIVFQDPSQQFIGATVEEEVSFGPMNLSLPDKEVEERVEEALVRMGLEGLRQRPPHYLSGGEKRRLSIADVLAMHPDLILLDEPTAFLDVKNTNLLEHTLNELHQQGKTLMVATHDMDFACRWATRILVFDHGKIITDNLPEVIFRDMDLLSKLKIKRPVIYELVQVLVDKGILPYKNHVPSTIAELADMIP